MKLNDLSDNKGARKSRTRVGRGPASGKGRTAGRGMKGQKSRSGVAIGAYEGGQMPLYMRLPKRGFNKPNRAKFAELNVGRLQAAIDAGKVDSGKKIDAAALVEAGVLRRAHDGVRLLGVGEITAKVEIEAAHATAGAKKAIEKAGGVVKLLKPAEKSEKTAKSEKKADKKAD